MKYLLFVSTVLMLILPPSRIAAESIDIINFEGVSSSMSNGNNPTALFDNDKSTIASFTLGNVIELTAPGPFIPVKYSLTAGDDTGKSSKKWRLEGSIDGKTWTLIDQRVAQSFSSGITREFSIMADKQNSYNSFRLNIEQTKDGGNECQLAEFHLMGEIAILPVSPSDMRVKPTDDGLIIAWRDNSDNETGFILERSLDGTNWSVVTLTDKNITSFIDNSVAIGIGAMYRVCAVINSCKSLYAYTDIVKTGDIMDLTNVNTNRHINVVGSTPIHSGQDGPKGADGNCFTKYLSTSLPAILTISLDEPITVTQYSLTSADDFQERDPKTWKVEASNDGQKWVTIDTKKDETFNARFQTNRYLTRNTEAYSHYRLTVTANAGAPLTQLADFCLFADIEPKNEVSELKTPTDLRLNVRTYNQIEVAWTDNNDNEECYIIQRSTDGENWTRDYITLPNDQRCYPYALKPNTTYYFRIAAQKGDSISEWSNVVTATTPGDEWPDSWPDFNFDWGYHTGSLIKYYSNDDIAIFVNPEDINRDGISIKDLDLSWMFEPYTAMWKAIRETYLDSYGEYLVSDPKLYIVPHIHPDGGGLGRLFHYRDPEQLYRNIVHVSVGKDSGWNWDQDPGDKTCNFLYDVLTHEIGHIIEGIGSGKKNSPFYPVWLDSKWAEIFQYDIFGKMNIPHQQVWHKQYNTPGVATENSPAPGSEWYVKWLYPTYRDFGGDKLFLRFFELLGKYYFQSDGELRGNGTLGEYIHFMSGAAGVDVTSYAKDAFGWCDEWEFQLMEARNRYPQVTYAEAPAITNLLMRRDATIKSSTGNNDLINNLKDGDRKTVFDTATKGTDIQRIELFYSSSEIYSAIDSFVLVAGGTEAKRPVSIKLEGSYDNNLWFEIFSDESPSYPDNSFTATVEDPEMYGYYKLTLGVKASKFASLEIYEWEMYGKTFAPSPHSLAGYWDGSAINLSWSAPYKGIEYFEIERATGKGEEFNKIATVDVMELSLLDADVEEQTTYTYRIREIGSDGYVSPYSQYLTLTTGNTGIITTTIVDISSLLDRNTANNVYLYNMNGVCIREGSMTGNQLRSLNDSSLPKGVYLLRVLIGNDTYTFKIAR